MQIILYWYDTMLDKSTEGFVNPELFLTSISEAILIHMKFS